MTLLGPQISHNKVTTVMFLGEPAERCNSVLSLAHTMPFSTLNLIEPVVGRNSMTRKLGVSLLAVVTLLLALNIASFAALQPALTHHTRDVVLNGQAPLV